MSFRRQQLNSLIRNEATTAILREVEFPIGTLVSVTGVSVSSDIENAVIMVSVIPSERKDDVLKILDKKRALIQTILFKKIKIMSLPRLSFEYDPGPEKAAAIEKISMESQNSSLKSQNHN